MKFSSSPVVELSVHGELLRFKQDNGSMHVGTSVWPCSLVLVKWMEHRLQQGDAQFDLRGKRGVELGSGCGIAGLGFSLFGLNTILTDIAPVLPALRKNVKNNVASSASLKTPGMPPSFAGKVKVAQLYWGNLNQIEALKPPFDFILATDVVYLENIVQPFLSTLCALAQPSSVIFLGYQMRSPEAHELFWRLCPELFHVRKVPHGDLHPDYAFEEADVFILTKK